MSSTTRPTPDGSSLRQTLAVLTAAAEDLGFVQSSEGDLGRLLRLLVASRPGGSFLELGTGGGERLIQLLEQTPERGVVHATEGWAPNVEVARANLAPLGVEVRPYDAEAGDRLPYDDGSMDFVMSRHEAIDPAEVARVLTPGGRLLTQQVHGLDAPEIHEWFGAAYEYPHVTAERFVADLEAAGLRIDAVAKGYECLGIAYPEPAPSQ